MYYTKRNMNIRVNQNPQQNIVRNNGKNEASVPSFGSAVDIVSQGLRYLNTNPAVGATLVDFGFMSLPRTLVDAQRGVDACVETGIRENSGTVNHVLIGTIGGAAAFALGAKLNKTFGVFSHAVFANNQTIDILGDIWHTNYQKISDTTKLQKAYFADLLGKVEGMNSQAADGKAWVKLDTATREKLVETLCELSQDSKLKGQRIPKDKMSYMMNLIISSTGAERNFKLISNGKTVDGFAINSFLEDAFALGKTFSKEKVMDAFKAAPNFADNAFIKQLKNTKMRAAMLALGVSSAIGASVQPFNRWLTKKRTGSDGFVGVKNNPDIDKKEKPSAGFIAAKVAAAAGMLAIAFASIDKNFKKIPGAVQFKGKIPTLAQYKLIYGVTVASRFLAARDKNELRESTFKDVLGFVNWLILGSFVAKTVATLSDKKALLNVDNTSGKKGFFHWLQNMHTKSVDEVLQHDLTEKGIKTVTDDGKAIPFKELLKKAKDARLDKTLKRVKLLGLAQIAGYVYSGVVLGVAIPKFNIWLTNKINKKNDVKAAHNAQIQTPETQNPLAAMPVNVSPVFADFAKN